jgi:glycosyltransferase involved in cell wall biosynthesis
MIDIVVGTHNRIDMLRRTVECIKERTSTPYRLFIINDGSMDGTSAFAKSQGAILHKHRQRMGMHQNLIDAGKLTKSDPVICTDDDALCPMIEPDWLAHLLEVLKSRPKLWMLGLNNPSDNITGSRRPYKDDGEVIYSKFVSGHFLAIRRNVLRATPYLFNSKRSRKSPNKTQARWVYANGGEVGYLKNVYTWHYCPESTRLNGKSWKNIMVEPVNMETLEPPEELRQWKL